MNRLLLSVLVPVCCVFIGRAQDPHFSQFYSVPLSLNPALAGGVDGTYRAGFVYRDQWRRNLEYPFSSAGAHFDIRVNAPFKASRGDKVGVGASFITDQVRGVGMVYNQLAFTGAYHKSLGFRNNAFLSAGFQLAFNQRSINFNNLTFGSMFNGLGEYNLDSGEPLARNNFSYPDLAVGGNYSLNTNRKFALYVGAAYNHVLGPRASFYKDPKIESNTLLRRLTLHGASQAVLSERLTLLPRILFMRQGPLMQLNGGSNIRYVVNHNDGTSVYLGAYGRGVAFKDKVVGLDALIPMFGLEFSKVLMGFTYDINLGTFRTPIARNAFEFSIIYLGDYENETILCPQF